MLLVVAEGLFTDLSRGWRASTTVSQTYWTDSRPARPKTSRQGATHTHTHRLHTWTDTRFSVTTLSGMELQSQHNKEILLTSVHTCCCCQPSAGLRWPIRGWGAYMSCSRATWSCLYVWKNCSDPKCLHTVCRICLKNSLNIEAGLAFYVCLDYHLLTPN